MESIKIFIQRTVEPIKIIVYNFPRIFTTQIRWENVFSNYSRLLIKLRTVIDWNLNFNHYLRTKSKIRLIVEHNPLIDFYGRTKSKSKTSLEYKIPFSSVSILRAKLKSSASHNAIFNAAAYARSFVFKRWINYSDTLKWSDIPDNMTMAEFIYNIIE